MGEPVSLPSSGEATDEPCRVIIEPSRGWAALNLRDLWEYRELLGFLVWRDVKVRYKQTLLGAAWAILQPTLTMVVFTIFFGRLAGIGSEGVPYPVFSYVGLLPWTFFAQGLTQSSNSLVGSSHLDHQGLLPAARDPSGIGPRWSGGLCPRLPGAARPDGLLRDRPDRRGAGPAGPPRPRLRHRAGRRARGSRRSTSSTATCDMWCPSSCRSGSSSLR